MTDTTLVLSIILAICLLFLASPFLPKRIVASYKKINKRPLVVLILIAMVFWFWTHSIFGVIYLDGPYHGRVVEAETGKPIEGAAVAGIWNMAYIAGIKELYSFGGAKETITDAEGKFTLNRVWVVWPWPFSWLHRPNILVFKAGYDCHPPEMQNAWTPEDEKQKKMTKHESYNKYYVRLEKSAENLVQLRKAQTLKERKAVLGFSVGLIPISKYIKLRNLICALDIERERFGLNNHGLSCDDTQITIHEKNEKVEVIEAPIRNCIPRNNFHEGVGKGVSTSGETRIIPGRSMQATHGYSQLCDQDYKQINSSKSSSDPPTPPNTFE